MEVAENLAMFPDRPLDPAAGLRLLADWFKVHDCDCTDPRDSEQIRADLLRWADEWTGLRLQVSALVHRVEEDEEKQVAIHDEIVALRGEGRGNE